jgi:flavin reductase (DIM6/NTAB) family NADH-FMN oxidoreductase RutF
MTSRAHGDPPHGHNHQSPGPFSLDSFRAALSLFATGVAIATTFAADGRKIGATISSFNSVSLEPPLVLFSVARNAQSFRAWESAAAFAINILSERQLEESKRFSRPLIDKWSGIACAIGVNGAPVLSGSLVSFECSRYAVYDGGDHAIIVGRATALHAGDMREPRPLLFFHRTYRHLDHPRGALNLVDWEALMHGW